jgi:hypothetical protein
MSLTRSLKTVASPQEEGDRIKKVKEELRKEIEILQASKHTKRRRTYQKNKTKKKTEWFPAFEKMICFPLALCYYAIKRLLF